VRAQRPAPGGVGGDRQQRDRRRGGTREPHPLRWCAGRPGGPCGRCDAALHGARAGGDGGRDRRGRRSARRSPVAAR
jgi:hypothetical protein